MPSLTGAPSTSPPLVSIFILSAAALAYEVLLVRLFSIIQWHHFAFMVISVALLGYGASGSIITVFRDRLLEKYNSVFVANIILFGISSIVCFIAVQQMPFNALEILWDQSQWLRLLLSYMLLTLPFFFVANAIGLTIMRFHQSIPLVYGIDLIGAGIGAMSIMILLQFLSPGDTLRCISMVSVASGIFALRSIAGRLKKVTISTVLFFMAAVFLLPQQWVDLRVSEYKGLAQTLLIKDAALLVQETSPVSQVDVVQSLRIPFRYASGMSLQSPVGPPDQLAVFRDADEVTAIDHVTDTNSIKYHDYLSSALPYHVHNDPQNVLILGSSTGAQILQANLHDVARIDAVEPDTKLSALLTDRYAEYFGWQRLKDSVVFHAISPRGFAASENDYDLVIVSLPGASAGGAAGVHALTANYDYTVEAIQSYLKLLAPDGVVSLTLWTSNPPRANLKLFATAVTSMKENGIDYPQKNIAWIRSWNTATLLLKNKPLTDQEINNIRAFSKSRGFDLAWIPGIGKQDVNRYQVIQEPLFYLAADSILTQAALDDSRSRFVQEYEYDIQVATDDRPYFNNYFKWSSMVEFLGLPGKTGFSMVGVGYPVLLVTLMQAVIAAFVLILLPLMFVNNKKGTTHKHGNIFFYFLSIGLAFLFIEIAFIQKFTLILSQPLYAVAVALCAFLVFSGLGSLYVQYRMNGQPGINVSVMLRRSVLLIGVISVLYIVLLPALSNTIMSWSETARILSAFVIAAPLAFVMGMPFSLGLASLQRKMPYFIPWAWGINGCASVLSAILAVILAIEIGFNGVILLAVTLYIIALLSYHWTRPG